MNAAKPRRPPPRPAACARRRASTPCRRSSRWRRPTPGSRPCSRSSRPTGWGRRSTASPTPTPDVAHFRALLTAAVTEQARIDQLMHQALVARWPIDRIDPTLRALFRAAGAELVATDTPPKVTINEYLDVAKAFYPEGKEARFVNGVLDHMARAGPAAGVRLSACRAPGGRGKRPGGSPRCWLRGGRSASGRGLRRGQADVAQELVLELEQRPVVPAMPRPLLRAPDRYLQVLKHGGLLCLRFRCGEHAAAVFQPRARRCFICVETNMRSRSGDRVAAVDGQDRAR